MKQIVQNILINLYWYCMKLLFSIYMAVNKCIEKIQIIIDTYQICIPQSELNNLLIVNNSIVKYSNYIDFIKTNELYDYLIYRIKINNVMLTQLIYDRDLINQLKNNKPNLQACNFEFIMVIIKNNNKSHDISNILKNHKNYYYVAGATLFDTNFMNWINLQYLNIELNNPQIMIMDNTIKEITLSGSQYIKLNQTDYTIIE